VNEWTELHPKQMGGNQSTGKQQDHQEQGQLAFFTKKMYKLPISFALLCNVVPTQVLFGEATSSY